MNSESPPRDSMMRRNRRSCLTTFLGLSLFFYAAWRVLKGDNSSANVPLPTLNIIAPIHPVQQVEQDKQVEFEPQELPEVMKVEEVKPKINSVFLLYISNTQADGIQNILLRKAIHENLNVALPQSREETMCFPLSFERTCPANKNAAPFDMMVHQVLYEKSLLTSYLKLDTKFITMVRHPIAHLQASYYDNEWLDYVGGKSFDHFIKYNYGQFSRVYDFDRNSPYRNIQLFGLGFSASHMDNMGAVIQKVNKLSQEFDLIMIQEYMLESLVLLKEELNWDTEDLVLFSLQSRPEDYNLNELTTKVNDTIILHNEGDMRMYEMILEKFIARVVDFGEERMRLEKDALQKAINFKTNLCLEKNEEDMKVPRRRIEYSLSWDGETDRDCHYYIARGSELTMLLKMEWDQKERIRKKKFVNKPLNPQHN